MEGLSMCRVCLGEDIRLLSIVGTHLQEMYESLVLMPVETTNGKPILACYICRARLQNCYELRQSCLQSEELFTQMLSCNESEKVKLQAIANKKRLTVHNAVHVSVVDELGIDVDNVGVEALKCEVKDEPNHGEDIDEDVLAENSVSDYVQCADIDDDFIITVKEEQIGPWTYDSTPKEGAQAVQRSFEDLTSSKLIEHEFIHDTFKKLQEVTDSDITIKNEERTTSIPRSQRVRYTCDTCQQCYSSKCELERHVCLCSDVWKKDLSRGNSTNAQKHSVQTPHQCNVCKKLFSQSKRLTRHMRTHTGEKPFKCSMCEKQFSQNCILIRHMRTHTGEKLYQCNMCKKQFSRKFTLQSHMRTHTGEKPYQCNVCKKRYSLKWYLRTHMRTHTGEKPYHCTMCEKQFTRKPSLTAHMCTHTGEKQYKCNVCEKSFSQNQCLIRHMRIHREKPFRCSKCKKQFSQNGVLIKHMRTHSDKKQYKCNVCKKQWSLKRDLIKHMQTHTGEKSYQCNLCNLFCLEYLYESIKRVIAVDLNTGEPCEVCPHITRDLNLTCK